LFFRAFYFSQAAWLYSKVYEESTADSEPGIVLRKSSDFNEKSVRSTIRQTYDQILNDAKNASILLPDYPQHVMRPSKGAAYGLLARVYLSMGKYDSAYKYADLCLQLNSELMDYNGDVGVIDITANVPFQKF